MSTQLSSGPVQRCGTAFNQRKSIDEALLQARELHPVWWVLFDEFSNLAVPGAADFEIVAELVNSAPNDMLAGYVSGLFENN